MAVFSRKFFLCRSHTLLIANYDPERDDGTFVCRTENIVGTDVGSVALNSGVLSSIFALISSTVFMVECLICFS